MRTALTERLGLTAPIIQAPMGGATSPQLAAAVSNAGGLGTLALSWSPEAQVREQIRETRRLTNRAFAVNLVLAFPQDERLAVCLEEGAPAVSLFWGDPAPFVERIHATGATVIHTTASAADARRAADAGVDILCAQGWEAGGHVLGEVATLPLTRAVVRAVDPTPVVAAGGVADGAALAAVLALGAAGAWIGTRFLMAEEAQIHPRYRARLLAATEADTFHSSLFDIGWPNAPHRVLRNATVEAWEVAGRPPSGQRPGEGEAVAKTPWGGGMVRYASATPMAGAEGDIDALSLWAGQGVAQATRVQPAAEIMRELMAEAEATIARLAALI